jgi:hypothetical protein
MGRGGGGLTGARPRITRLRAAHAAAHASPAGPTPRQPPSCAAQPPPAPTHLVTVVARGRHAPGRAARFVARQPQPQAVVRQVRLAPRGGGAGSQAGRPAPGRRDRGRGRGRGRGGGGAAAGRRGGLAARPLRVQLRKALQEVACVARRHRVGWVTAGGPPRALAPLCPNTARHVPAAGGAPGPDAAPCEPLACSQSVKSR